MCTSETEPSRHPLKMHVSEASYFECGPSGINEKTSGCTETDTVHNGSNDIASIGECIVKRVQKSNQSEHETSSGKARDFNISSEILDKEELRWDEQRKDTSGVDRKCQKVEIDEPIEPHEDTEQRHGADEQESNLTVASSKFKGLELQTADSTEPSSSTQSSLSDAALTSFGVAVVETSLCDVQGSSSPSDVQPKKRTYVCVLYICQFMICYLRCATPIHALLSVP